MHLFHYSLLWLSLAASGQAGPVVVAIAYVAGAIAGEAAFAGVASSAVAAACGVTANAVWFGTTVITSQTLFWGSTAVAGVTISAAAGGAMAGIVAEGMDGKKTTITGTDASSIVSSLSSLSEASSKSIASVSSVSEASVASVKSVELVKSVKSELSVKSEKSVKSLQSAWEFERTHWSQLSKVKSSMYLSMINNGKATELPSEWEKYVYPTSKLTAGPLAKPTVTGTIPGVPGMNIPDEFRANEVPAGVPEYNFRMCQYDLIRMRDQKRNMTFDNPQGYDFLVTRIPSTCMVLAATIANDPKLGPHPVVAGSDALRWNNVNATFVSPE